MSSSIITKTKKSVLLNALKPFGVNVCDKEEVARRNKIDNSSPLFYTDIEKGLNVIVIPNILDTSIANKLYKNLLNIDYRSDEESMVKIMGVMHKIPRKQTAFGLKGTSYSFAGTSVEVEDWDSNDFENEHTNEVAQLIRFIASILSVKYGREFNYALINYYINENSKIGFHADDERELGTNPMILGISLGEERQIHFKHKSLGGKTVKATLPHNSLMIMDYPTNTYWKHSIPAGKTKMKPRISLTFRGIEE
jgi:alpha-ketoglutarate-dependent dioxygenase alkB family protein 2